MSIGGFNRLSLVKYLPQHPVLGSAQPRLVWLPLVTGFFCSRVAKGMLTTAKDSSNPANNNQTSSQLLNFYYVSISYVFSLYPQIKLK